MAGHLTAFPGSINDLVFATIGSSTPENKTILTAQVGRSPGKPCNTLMNASFEGKFRIEPFVSGTPLVFNPYEGGFSLASNTPAQTFGYVDVSGT